VTILQNIPKYFFAKYRAFAPLSCLDSPRSDVLSGWQRWRWLARCRRAGRLIEPSVRFQGDVAHLDECVTLGPGTHLDQGVIVWLGNEGSNKGLIRLASRVYVGPYSYLGASGHSLEIGEDTMIGANSYIITENHVTARKDIPYARQGYTGADVIIGRNVWIGCHVTVLPGVTIGDDAIIGAGAVVTKNVPSGETWAGVPAVQLEHRDTKTSMENHPGKHDTPAAIPGIVVNDANRSNGL
jgi:acetyltransferase-like isoleucine patch superfamily enzyme